VRVQRCAATVTGYYKPEARTPAAIECSFSPSRAKEDERGLHEVIMRRHRFIAPTEKVGVFVYMSMEGDGLV